MNAGCPGDRCNFDLPKLIDLDLPPSNLNYAVGLQLNDSRFKKNIFPPSRHAEIYSDSIRKAGNKLLIFLMIQI